MGDGWWMETETQWMVGWVFGGENGLRTGSSFVLQLSLRCADKLRADSSTVDGMLSGLLRSPNFVYMNSLGATCKGGANEELNNYEFWPPPWSANVE